MWFLYFNIEVHQCFCCFPAKFGGINHSKKNCDVSKLVQPTICTIISSSKHFLFLRKWLLANCWLLSDVCNNLRAFLLPVSMTTAWHAWLLRKREGDKLSFSLRQNAFSPIYSYSLTGKYNRSYWSRYSVSSHLPPLSYHCTVFAATAKLNLIFMKKNTASLKIN